MLEYRKSIGWHEKMNTVHPAEGLHLQTQNSEVAYLGQMSLTYYSNSLGESHWDKRDKKKDRSSGKFLQVHLHWLV